MSSTIPFVPSADKPLWLALILSFLGHLPRPKVLGVLLPVVAGILEMTLGSDEEDGSFCRFEDHLHEAVTEIGRFAIERRLLKEALVQPDRVEIDGVAHKGVCWGMIEVTHSYGTLLLPRRLYRPVGVRGVKGTLNARMLELKLGLIDKTTPRQARIQARFDAECPSRLAVELMALACGVAPGRSRQERFGKKVSSAMADHLATGLEQVRCDTVAPQQSARVLLSLDRFRVLMNEPCPDRPLSKATVRHRKSVPYQRKPPERFELKGRMVYVASATLYDEQGRSLGTFRYAAPHDADPAELVAQLRNDVLWVRRLNPEVEVDVCLDGAKDLWKVMQAGLEGLPGPPLRQVVDWYHFWERTHPSLKMLWEEKEIKKWKKKLLTKSDGVTQLRAAMWKRVAELHAMDVYDEVERFDKYVFERPGLFDYAAQRRDKRNLGSGSVESSCKQIGARMRRSGQRWKAEGARGRLALRANYCSGPTQDHDLPEMQRGDLVWDTFAAKYTAQIRFTQPQL